ncbi:YqaJ viral recombinase family protein [Legionella maceachernii]|uniref:YqaJ-like viral recombinase domain protein n=1 Tax=Legionella maceachernii TaxID=466 RepID=A0A0W0WBB1_9GAMM|nr:YqaJ viral recombinase family protein [Legionella maceachernii]KTD29653.1 YqaJ-like viral recombinase domain protein [Legionella maceachernii]SKA20825.1 putative phage-type endonuclease [Legionella maceachernii]SUP02641.1 putative phage-type endonuclease [Legionella maceachernii]
MLTEEQRAKRQNGIGASDTPIIMGYSSYKTPYQLYLEKTGVIEVDEEMTEQQYWGNALEPVIIKRFAEENNVEISFPDTAHHPDYPFIFANLDGWIESEKAVVEAKSANSFQRKEWDMALTDGIPLVYLIQIAKQCAITNASRGYCAVLIGGMKYKQFVYERDKELETVILQADIDFWECVQRRQEPPPLNTSDCRLKFPTPSPDKIAHATFKTDHALKTLTDYKSRIKELQEHEETQKMHLMSHMGDAEYLMGHEGELLATWKATKKGTRVFNIK